ncbi:MAG: ABC transporter permease [Candidatus Hodarchaeales archaeon]|jgi:NitT/TauT family transport system permease protein
MRSFLKVDSFFVLISPTIILLFWEIIVRLGLVESLFFPPPTIILATLFELLQRGELQPHVFISLRRMFFGFLLGSFPGLILGLIMGWSSRVRIFFDPLVSAIYPIPKIALLPLIMLIFGIGEMSKIVLIAIGCFFLVLINSMAGVTNINKIYFEVAKNYGASEYRILTQVVLMGSLPMIFAGLRLALGLSLILVVAAEMVSANHGLGAMIWLAWETMRTEKMYIGIIVIGFLGLLFTSILKRIERYFIPWEMA